RGGIEAADWVREAWIDRRRRGAPGGGRDRGRAVACPGRRRSADHRDASQEHGDRRAGPPRRMGPARAPPRRGAPRGIGRIGRIGRIGKIGKIGKIGRWDRSRDRTAGRSDPWKVCERWGSVPSVVSVLSLPSVPSIPSVSAMLKVALTGGIATGKSYVLNRFRHLGVPCLDADELAHGVEAAGTQATAAIAPRVGGEGP